MNHEAEAARGALAFDHAGQAARLKSPRFRDGGDRLETKPFVKRPAFMSIVMFGKKNRPVMHRELGSPRLVCLRAGVAVDNEAWVGLHC